MMCILRAGVAKLVYAPDSKSGEVHSSCRFESDLRHQCHWGKSEASLNRTGDYRRSRLAQFRCTQDSNSGATPHGSSKTVKLSHRFTKPRPAELLYKPTPLALRFRLLF